MADSNDLDVEMTEGVGASGPSPSPFLLLNPPKLELTASPPRNTQPVKPKFAPKVKPRPGARVRTQQPAQTEAKVEAGKILPKAERSIPPVPEAAADVSISEEKKIPSASAEVPLVAPKAEPNVVKVEIVKEEALENSLPFKVKEEPGAEEVEDLKLKTEIKEDFSDFSGLHGVKEELSGVKEEVVGVKDEFLALGQGDRVVREVDVFLTPNVDSETQLYLLQYPLRPHWRPYGLEERCQEVRIKPQLSKFEVDLVIDTNSANYDPDREPHLLIEKQTLTSSKVPVSTSYAIGILRGNQLHLNPIQAVVQLRPSMKYIDDHDAAKKTSNKDAGIVDGEDEEMPDAEPTDSKSELTLLQVSVRRRETERQEATRLQSHAYLKQIEEAEAWIPLEPHGTDSPVTEGIRQKMVTSTNDPILFDMNADAYIDTLVPGRASTSAVEVLREDGSGNAGISRSFLDTLSLEDRFDVLLSKGRVQVFQFERLMKLAPTGCTEAEVLEVISNKAVLIQGCWVAISGLRYEYPVSVIRDYVLFLFMKNRVVLHEQLKVLPVSKEVLREIMISIAVQRGAAGWEFQESTDRSFIKKHQAIVKAQATQWAESEEDIRASLAALNPSVSETDGAEPMEVVEEVKRPNRKGEIKAKEKQQRNAPASTATKPPPGGSQGNKAVVAAVADGGDGSVKTAVENGDSSGHVTMSDATRAALPGALREIFLKHHVCSMQIICQSLRDMAIERTASNSNPKAAAAAVAAAKGANAPLPELTAAVNKVATSINGVYFLQSLGNPSLDPFRNVIIMLLRAKEPDTGLRRLDIMESCKISLKSEPPSATYQKVMKELCYTRGGAWVLKPGDGRPT